MREPLAAVSSPALLPLVGLTSPGGRIAASVDPVGARIASLVHTPTGREFLLRTPWADEDLAHAPSSADTSYEWHRRYAGGWHTLVPHAGDAVRIEGVEHPFHGEAAWRRWLVIDAAPDELRLEVRLRTVPLVVTRRIRVAEEGVRVVQTVSNASSGAVAFSWTEHPALSDVVIGPRTRMSLDGIPVDVSFPHPEARRSAFAELRVGGGGEVSIRNPDTGARARLRWDAAALPYLYVWQEHRTPGFPWWGAVDTIGIEPASRPYDGAAEGLGPLVVPGRGELTLAFELDVDVDGEQTLGR